MQTHLRTVFGWCGWVAVYCLLTIGHLLLNVGDSPSLPPTVLFNNNSFQIHLYTEQLAVAVGSIAAGFFLSPSPKYAVGYIVSLVALGCGGCAVFIDHTWHTVHSRYHILAAVDSSVGSSSTPAVSTVCLVIGTVMFWSAVGAVQVSSIVLLTSTSPRKRQSHAIAQMIIAGSACWLLMRLLVVILVASATPAAVPQALSKGRLLQDYNTAAQHHTPLEHLQHQQHTPLQHQQHTPLQHQQHTPLQHQQHTPLQHQQHTPLQHQQHTPLQHQQHT
eukprot:Lankesteria_metandrocarpae@DN1883_c0_g1_i1.p1